ncbi:MAG: aminopeptidase P family protein [Deltaproteobacteria bacterium]|nr:aminopeptidase P family protein [Deltaproteobacteria bacterium]
MRPFQPQLRIRELQKNLTQANLDIALLHYSRDIYYYTGFAEPSLLLVTPQESILFIRREKAKERSRIWMEEGMIVARADLREVYAQLIDLKIKKGTMGLCLDILPADRFTEIQELFQKFRILNVSPLILRQRMVKDEEEVSLVKRAGQILAAGTDRVRQFLKPGLREIDLAAEIEAEHRRSLHVGAIFTRLFDFSMGQGPLSSGPNLRFASGILHSISGPGLSAALPIGPSDRKIQNGDHVVVDIPCNYQGYHADQSRTFVVGKASSKAKKMFRLMREVSDGLIAFLRPGIQAYQVYKKAWSLAKKLKIEDSFLAYGERRANFIGHGLGLEINEPPILKKGEKTILEEGFTLALELLLTHPNAGIMKLEDTVVVTSNGAELLTIAPRELIEVG